jgi:hypothetical protein
MHMGRLALLPKHKCESDAEQSSDKGTCQHVFYHLIVSLLWDFRADGEK